jgi:TatD DNase family protein
MFDSHAHLTSTQILPELDAVVERAKRAGVEKIVNICTDEASLEEGLRLAQRDSGIYTTAATTPHDVEKEGEAFFPIVEKHVKKLVAIGETGLDYFYEHSPKKKQLEFLSRYFELALRANLPVIFHCRDAFDDLFSVADGQYRDRKAILHCFTGTKQEAGKCLDRNWLISFSGIITFKKSEELRQVVKYVPLEQMLIETDSPYLAPQSMRGKQNEPAFMKETALKIAEVKGLAVEQVIQTTSENAMRFFPLN